MSILYGGQCVQYGSVRYKTIRISPQIGTNGSKRQRYLFSLVPVLPRFTSGVRVESDINFKRATKELPGGASCVVLVNPKDMRRSPENTKLRGTLKEMMTPKTHQAQTYH